MVTKECLACRRALPLTDFSRNKRKRDGLDSYCKKCTGARGAAHYQKTKAKRREQNKAWRQANPGKAAKYCAAWRDRNPGAQGEADRSWYARNAGRKLAADKARREQNRATFLERERGQYRKHLTARKGRNLAWRQANPHRINAYASERRAARAKRTPPWLTDEHREQIRQIYARAVRLTGETAVPHHVDHAVPLRGRFVSGLHVPWNLQVLPAVENLQKNNRFEVHE
jgi:hypothetical protein